MQKIRSLVNSYEQEFEELIIQTIGSKAEMAETIAHHVFSTGGKRLRPGLVIAASACCGDKTSAGLIHLALAVEMLHAASLLHDDVIDAGMIRRNAPSANAQWGNKRAILAGDFLFSRAFAYLQTHGGANVVSRALATALDLTEGEFLQLEASEQTDTQIDQSLEIARAKTASLFASACYIGALHQSKNEGLANCLAQYGNDMGMAFQLWDDVLDYTGDPEIMGKAIGSDLRENRKTLPLLYGLQSASEAQMKIISRAMGNADASDDQIKIACDVICNGGAVEKVKLHASDYTKRAISRLDDLPASNARDALHELAEFAITRSA